MNTTRTRSLQALTAAAFLTLAMLLGVNGLAVMESTPAQMAAQTDSAHA